MKKSLFVYNEGTLQRHDNTIRFIDTAGNKKDIPIETVGEIYYLKMVLWCIVIIIMIIT